MRALAVQHAAQRRVAFLVDAAPRNFVLRRLCDWRSLPADPENASEKMRRLLAAGKSVCTTLSFSLGRERNESTWLAGVAAAAKECGVPIVAVGVDLVFDQQRWMPWESRFAGIPRTFPFRVNVAFLSTRPGAQRAQIVNQVLMASHDAYARRRAQMRPVHGEFLRSVRRRPWAKVCADLKGRQLSRLRLLGESVAMARELRRRLVPGESVGIALDPSVDCVVINMAASLAGRTAVNINFDEGVDHISSAIEQAGLSTMFTSRTVSTKVLGRFPADVPLQWMEEIPRVPRWQAGVLGALASLAPLRMTERFAGAARAVSLDDVASVVFSSGTTSKPKGIMLTHYCILSNADQLHSAARFDSSDRTLHNLPFFHISGYHNFVFHLVRGIPILMYEDPEDPRIGSIVREHRITNLVVPPSALRDLMRANSASDFASLRSIQVIGQKLPEPLAVAATSAFGFRPFEIYGASELGGAVTISEVDRKVLGKRRFGWRPGYAGRLLSGMAMRVVDPSTGEALAPGQEGLLFLRGPFMGGYVAQPEKTAEVLKDGWYATGDLGYMDLNGFLKVTDRLSRHSRVEGVPVSHAKVEESLQKAAGSGASDFCVTSVLFEDQLEKLAVVHTHNPSDMPRLLSEMSTYDLPVAYLPQIENCIHVDSLPRLGSGKLDLRSIMNFASDRLGGDYRAGKPASS